MQHTPGPWTATSYDTADGDEGGTVLHRITAHAAGAAVADQIFTESDARLIAAAPDLLAALADLLACTMETYDNRHEIAAALDAIAAAKGQP